MAYICDANPVSAAPSWVAGLARTGDSARPRRMGLGAMRKTAHGAESVRRQGEARDLLYEELLPGNGLWGSLWFPTITLLFRELRDFPKLIVYKVGIVVYYVGDGGAKWETPRGFARSAPYLTLIHSEQTFWLTQVGIVAIRRAHHSPPPASLTPHRRHQIDRPTPHQMACGQQRTFRTLGLPCIPLQLILCCGRVVC